MNRGGNGLELLSSYNYLEKLMLCYQVKDLINVDEKSFKKKLDEFLQLRDHEMEGFKDPKLQRDLSIKFHWGHNHDFGKFSLKGKMKDRHISIIATFINDFKAIPLSLEGLKVLDIGCWTGGTSLLLCAMGAQVVAIEEVKKYVDSLNYLKYAFKIDRLEPKNLSLYDCNSPSFQDSFDIVLFSGVLYHVTDPILALRITFNCLRDGGKCLVETVGVDSDKRVLSYYGPTVFGDGKAEDLSRAGWNWFLPSPPTLAQMMADVGYTEVEVGNITKDKRIFAVSKRKQHMDIMRSGFSDRTVR